MEFWGIEVKPGQTVKCQPGDENVLHLSQASLGESKKEKGNENVPIFVKFNDQKLVIGTLSVEKCAQIQYDLVFEKEFELSHGAKNTSVFFVGYRVVNQSYESEDGVDDSSSEDDLEIDEKTNGKPSKNLQGKSTVEKTASGKDDNVAAKLKTNTGKKLKKEQVNVDKKADKDVEDDSDDEDEDDSEEDSDEDEDIVEAPGDSSDEDEDDSSEEETTPEKIETDKKRKADSVSKTHIPEKKAKVVTPAGNQKTGGDGKKGHVHVATPHPSKQSGKPQQSPKSGGPLTCKSCSRTFNSENALQAHNKAKHGAAAK